MYRLLGYATASFSLSLNAVLGQDSIEDFCELFEIHNDGWGVAQPSDPVETPHVRDGDAPTPETGTQIYESTIAAHHGSTFETPADEPSHGVIWHLRLVSSNLPLIMENQHPFYANDLSFTHNGNTSGANDRNIATNRLYPVSHSVFLSTDGHSDSVIFFAVTLEYIGFGSSLDEVVAQAARELRQTYPKSSYSCMVQFEDRLITLCVTSCKKINPRIVEIYDEYDRGEQAANYHVMHYRELRDDNDSSTGVVVSSSGYEQEGQNILENDQTIIASDRSDIYRPRSI